MDSISVNLNIPESCQTWYSVKWFKDLSDFIKFVAFRVQYDSFHANIEGQQFHITVMPEIGGYGWVAIEDGMYGGEPGSIYQNHSMESPADALEGLIEKIKDSID